MSPQLTFALNHIATPRLSAGAFFDLARGLGIDQVEIRNDLPGVAIADGTAPEAVRQEADAHGVRILTVNALYPFDVWNAERVAQADALARYAAAAGVEALVLCPLNSVDDQRSEQERAADLRAALAGLLPILELHGIIGLVEPLGFPESALRTKRKAVDAIDEVGAGAPFRLLHDTFHHYLAGEHEFFPERTGLVHISGVEDGSLPIDAIRDEHRVLVGTADIMDNVGQIRALRTGGYPGPFSLEPFSPTVHALADPAAALRDSFSIVARQVGRSA
jgi:2-keto-myo-inositol isomerase